LGICPDDAAILLYCTYKETGPTGNPLPPALYAARDEKVIGMLTDIAPHCEPQHGRTSPVLGWSIMTVKPVGSRRTYDDKTSNWMSKCHFFMSFQKLKKDLQDVSAGTGQFVKKKSNI
jgi:hypothetical protein